MQALRMASYMNQPTLLAIQTLVMMGPYLTNTGRFLDAWTLFGTTIRLAHSIGLHRNPKLLNPTPPLRECMIRQTLWWWMLHMDQQYSVTLGRPLGISGIGDCPPPEPLTPDPTVVRLGEFVDHFTILARQILSSDGLMSVAKIDEFTDKLICLWQTMPEALQFNESWCQPDTPLPDWPLEVMSATLFAKVQSFIILLNRQRIERTQHMPGERSPPGSMMPPSRHQMASSAYGGLEHPVASEPPVRGRDLVLNSSKSILKAFIFLQRRRPAVLICWTMAQQAFNACMILILEAWETGDDHDFWLVDQAFIVFQELEKNRLHKLAGLAVERISDGIGQLGQRRQERERQAAASRRSSAQQPALMIDTAMMDWSNEGVMGNTGMFLLEDPGLQSFTPPAFQPLAWNMTGTTHTSNPATPGIPSPVPVSQVTAAPFPVMTSSYISSAIPVTNSPFAIGLQPRMPSIHQHHHRRPQLSSRQSHLQQQDPDYFQQQMGGPQAFTPINPSMTATGLPMQQTTHHHSQPQSQQQHHSSHGHQSFSQVRGPRHSHHSGSSSAGGGPRGVHKVERHPGGSRSAQRRK
jgi:hypothetical protein